MKVAIVGSRDFPVLSLVKSYIYTLPREDIIVSGGAKGVDQMAEKTAKERGMNTVVFLPDWDRHGKGAGFLRNKEIVALADVVVAFWDGFSRGTLSTIDLAREAGKPLMVRTMVRYRSQHEYQERINTYNWIDRVGE